MSVPAVPAPRCGRDLARAPLLGPVLRWRHLRTTIQSALLIATLLVILDGLTGSPIAPQNLAGVVPWVAWRGLTILGLLVAGSLFCAACPFVLVRRLSKAILSPRRSWPTYLRGKWLAAGILVVYFWFYEALDPWASPSLTAAIAVAYFGGAFLVDGLFRGAAFCKYLCPIGQFSFVSSVCSPLEVRALSTEVCRDCRTKDCVAGSAQRERERECGRAGEGEWGSGRAGDGMNGQDSAPRTQDPTQSSVLSTQSSVHYSRRQQGCELFLFQGRKTGNLDCTFCLDCLHACPHDNVGVLTRLPVRELWTAGGRSGTGVLAERTDLAFLVLVVVFAAFMNALGMVKPFYDLERSLILLLGGAPEGMALGMVFLLGLVVLPVLLVCAAAIATVSLVGSGESLKAIGTRLSFSLVPVGLGMWGAHYGYHFLSGGLSVIPVAQSLSIDLGLTWVGEPRWDLGPLVPESWLLPVELVLLEAGLLASLLAAHRLALFHYRERSTALRAFVPWAVLAILLFVAGVWLMLQPMEMRGMQTMVSTVQASQQMVAW